MFSSVPPDDFYCSTARHADLITLGTEHGLEVTAQTVRPNSKLILRRPSDHVQFVGLFHLRLSAFSLIFLKLCTATLVTVVRPLHTCDSPVEILKQVITDFLKE